ncbi:MAG: TIGR04086 family membrane protein [Thermoanaerobacteraceae bacterium]|nr:TIGR04086 family membrane protein [Thermoanaerobacteraceae bacterium]
MDREWVGSIKNVIEGVLIGYVLAIVIFLIYGIVLSFTSVSEETMPSVTKVVSGITIFLSGLLSARKIKGRGWLYGGLAGFIYIILLLILSVIFLKGFQFNSNVLLDIAIAILIGALGGILGINI